MRRKICGIYKITNPTGRIYIGSSKDVLSRHGNYRGFQCKTQRRIYNSLLKYGYESHTFEIIEECELSLLLERERFWALHFNVLDRNKGLNCHIPKIAGIEWSEEAREMKSKKMQGSGNPFFGKKHTKQTIEKVSISSKSRTPHNKGVSGIYKASEAAKNNMRKAQLGRKHTCETLEKMKLSNSNLKIVLNTSNGIFYTGGKEAAESMNLKHNTFKGKLNGNRYNNTPFVFV